MIRRPPRSTLFPSTPLSRSMTATPDLADRYLAAWNETDHAARAAAMAGLFADDVRYTDPLVEAEGRDALHATIGAVHQQLDRKSTRLNSSHANISYAVFCLK